ncbi:MAG: carboxylating nicotinate-nucleotide diphosphorylase [Sphingomonadales bacterium]
MSGLPFNDIVLAGFIADALAEDLGDGDITAQAVIPPDEPFSAAMVARQPMVVAGLPLAVEIFKHLDPAAQIDLPVADGARVETGQTLLSIAGNARAILAGERTALNLVQHLSGIASLTARYVAALAGTRATLLDTRKTLPLYRGLAKYATALGGAQNHRMGLYDAILIKDNHIAVAGSLAEAVRLCRDAGHGAIEVECDTLAQVREAIDAGATRILLDNMSLEELRQAVGIAEGLVSLEASGGVTLETIRAIAQTGVDYISVGGALTLSAPAMDIGLDYAPLA